MRRHFIHHNNGAYLVIPNLYSADPTDEDEAAKALAMNQLAGVLSDLDLVRWPYKKEMAKLKEEEAVFSDTDLTHIRKQIAEKLDFTEEERKPFDKPQLRNHGLFSKSERMLELSGWGELARRDIEIFKLTDTEGLTPLLSALNDANVSDET